MNQGNIRRCDWCKSDPVYLKYHDEEWGREITDDDKMFEFLVLESAQAGLSWITILKRRNAYRHPHTCPTQSVKI
ncbi:DNA-3-methyladenine glycosylase 1 [termite gut metagenome]|uniref:DNA-3-methyladenine glycosylase 1 n=1 Tax=termite gut metagenome TaxID=433724 RepID=A0A5J4RNT3_9ZZZZ